MFAKHEMGAKCLGDYEYIKEGALVVRDTMHYALVEEWRKTNEWLPLPEEPVDNSVRIKEIEDRLLQLDLLSLRPERELLLGQATDYTHEKLRTLEEERVKLREELRGITNGQTI